MSENFPRRPLVAYTFQVNHDDPEGPRYGVYCDAYGLEMTIDDEFPVDTILLVPDEFIDVITDETDLTSMGTVFGGASSIPKDADGSLKLSNLVPPKTNWLLIDCTTSAAARLKADFDAALAAGINVICRISDADQVDILLSGCDPAKVDQLNFAIQSGSQDTAAKARLACTEVRVAVARHQFLSQKVRVIISAETTETKLLDYVLQPDIDGVLILDGSYGRTAQLVGLIADNC